MPKGIPSNPFVGNYRHAQPLPRGNPYLAIRQYLGLSQARIGALMGISQKQVQYRERTKRLFHVGELVVLQQVSGMDDQSFMKLLRDIA
jgi:transcriptional regulator with XRE-family HTH domain